MKGVFDAFRNVRKKNRSEGRAVAVNHTHIRSEDFAPTELLDFALIDETMLFTDKIRSLIMASDEIVDEDVLRKAAVEDGMTTLPDAARQLVLTGETSLEEAVRVTGS